MKKLIFTLIVIAFISCNTDKQSIHESITITVENQVKALDGLSDFQKKAILSLSDVEKLNWLNARAIAAGNKEDSFATRKR